MQSLRSFKSRLFYAFLLVFLLVVVQGRNLTAQTPPLDRVMTMTGDMGGGQPLGVDRGSTGLWQRLLKLQTTASLLHTTAHPDDEHAGMLTYLSRGLGARTALLTLNRGEGGANAIGAELFDGLGLIRTEELRLSGRYYGLDDQYFTTVVDYGYSKTLGEALRSWDREALLGEMVRVLRLNRPLVVVSRFHGSERDGHGHHQAAGGLTPEAVRAAGDPAMFPEQITQEGLRPWQPLKLYRGGVREAERWHVRLDVGQHNPWLGASYQHFGMYGLSLQRSQTSGRTRERLGPVLYYYEGLDGDEPGQEEDFFDDLDTSLSGLFQLTAETPPSGTLDLLEAIEGHAEDALRNMDVGTPSAVVPDLVLGLRKTRQVLGLLAAQPEAAFMLRIKEQQFMDAINAALGLQFTAVGMPADTEPATSPWAPPPLMGLVVPGQTFRVDVHLLNPSPRAIEQASIALAAAPDWTVEGTASEGQTLRSDQQQPIDMAVSVPQTQAVFTVRVPDVPVLSQRYFYRQSIRENQYQVRDSAYLHLPVQAPGLMAVATYDVMGEPVRLSEPVRTREANLPYGYLLRELGVAPALVVNVKPEQRIVVPGQAGDAFDVEVELVNNHPGAIDGDLRLETPEGWPVSPDHHRFGFGLAGQRQLYTFRVAPPRLEQKDYALRAVASAMGRTYRQGYDAIRHRDMETRYLYKPAIVQVHSLDVAVAPNLNVGYVMGVGDEVPAGIEQLGARVRLMTAEDLASGDLASYDAIVVGTRAYAVRQDLLTYNQRLLDYAHAGGNLIVLYQTQEFVPNDMAPYPAQLPRGAEEVSEEDAPVTLLQPDHPLFTTPNAITASDFEAWVEQRGSKFFTTWDPAYTPLIETHDTGQQPQQGAWLTARHGEGFYTYFALAIHRQLPYAVPGPFRIFANLLSLGQN